MRKEPFEQVRHVASKVADVALDTYQQTELTSEASLAMERSEVTLARRKPSSALLAKSRSLLADPPESVTPQQAIYAQRAVALYDGPDQVSVVL